MTAIIVIAAVAISATNLYLIMRVSEVASKLNGVADQVDAIKVNVQALLDSQGDPELGTAGDEAVNRVTSSVQALADIVPVATPPPPA